MSSSNFLTKNIQTDISVKEAMLSDDLLQSRFVESVDAILLCYKNGGKVLLAGNGGSAADAQHIAAELSGRYFIDRGALYAEALHVNTSYVTAVANDYGYDEIYARLVTGIGKPEDVLILLSTSGNSPNILKAAAAARAVGMTIIAMTGTPGGQLVEMVDIALVAPSTDTPHIQEGHILIGHSICEAVESSLF